MKEFLKALYEEKLNMSDVQLHEIAIKNGFDLCSHQYRVMIVSSGHNIDSPEHYQRYCVNLAVRCQNFFGQKRMHAEAIADYTGKCIVLFMEECERQHVGETARMLLDCLAGRGYSDAIVAIGKGVQSLAEVASSYRSALNTLNYQSLYIGERCLFYEDVRTMLRLPTLQSVIDPEKVLQAFQAGNLDEVRMLVTVYAEKVRALSGTEVEGRHPTSIRRMFVELTVYVLHIASDMGVDVDLLLNGLDPYNFLLAEGKTTPMIIDWFMDMCLSLRRAIDEKEKSKEQSIVQLASNYIDEHIGQYDLSLDNVSAAVNMTPSYLSRLFHKEKGVTYSKYIVQRRLEIANQLLTETELSVKKISEIAGFASANYFGSVFKKAFGVSPNVYRGIHSEKKSKNE